jgi:hypothetical protein
LAATPVANVAIRPLEIKPVSLGPGTAVDGLQLTATSQVREETFHMYCAPQRLCKNVATIEANNQLTFPRFRNRLNSLIRQAILKSGD